MRHYELNCLISSNLSEKELKLLQEKIKNFIQEEDGVSIEVKNPVKRNLGHSKTETAYLVVLNFNLASEKLGNLEKKLKSENQIIRYLILNLPAPRTVRPAFPKTPLVPIQKVDELRSSSPTEPRNNGAKVKMKTRFSSPLAGARVVNELRLSSPTEPRNNGAKAKMKTKFSSPLAGARVTERVKKNKVELKKIEEKLEEILGEN